MLVSNINNHKQNCEFAEDSIAFLYGELNEAQSAKFNGHLKNCSNCADEVKAFSSIHSSIQNWKAAEFDILATPIIEISTDSPQKSVKETIVSNSWLTNLREFFSFQRGLVQVGAFAALLMCLCFGLYFLNFYNQKNNLAENADNKNIDEIAKVEKSNSNSQNQSNSKKAETNPSADSQLKSPAVEKNSPAKETAPLAISTSPKNPANSRKPADNNLIRDNKTPKNNRKISPVNNRRLPKLNALPEETEDEDLRLADLFAEIDSR